MSLEIKSCVLDSWDFFPKIIWGAVNSVSGEKSQELKSGRKKLRGKEKGNMNSVI